MVRSCDSSAIPGAPGSSLTRSIQKAGIDDAHPLTSERFVLRTLTSPGEVRVELSLGTMPLIDLDDTPGMSRKMRYTVKPAYVVTADPPNPRRLRP